MSRLFVRIIANYGKRMTPENRPFIGMGSWKTKRLSLGDTKADRQESVITICSILYRYPQSGITSVTVIAENGCLADAPSTAYSSELVQDLLKGFRNRSGYNDETENIDITKVDDCFEVFIKQR